MTPDVLTFEGHVICNCAAWYHRGHTFYYYFTSIYWRRI